MIVLDAAALVDVVVGQEGSEWLLDRLVGQDVCAPAHQPAEVLSAIARLQRSGALDADAAAAALAAASAVQQELVLPTPRQLQRSLQLAGRIRVVDGLYVALAEERGCPVLTSDRRLARADPPCEVLAPPGD